MGRDRPASVRPAGSTLVVPADGPVTVTAGAAPTVEEMASIASEVSRRTVDLVLLSREKWTVQRVAGGQPEAVVGFILGMHGAAAAGSFAGSLVRPGRRG